MKKRHYKKLYKKLKDRAYIRMPLHSLFVQQRENEPRTFMAALKVYRAELNFFGQTYAKTRLLRDLFNSEVSDVGEAMLDLMRWDIREDPENPLERVILTCEIKLVDANEN